MDFRFTGGQILKLLNVLSYFVELGLTVYLVWTLYFICEEFELDIKLNVWPITERNNQSN